MIFGYSNNTKHSHGILRFFNRRNSVINSEMLRFIKIYTLKI